MTLFSESTARRFISYYHKWTEKQWVEYEKVESKLFQIQGENVCPTCSGQEIVSARYTNPSMIDYEIVKRWFPCECEKNNKLLKDAEANSVLSPTFKKKTFDNWDNEYNNGGNSEAFEFCKGYAHQFRTAASDGLGLLLMGTTGIGKDHLAASVIQKAMQKGYLCVMESAPEIIDLAYSKKSNIDIYKVCGLLCISDIGREIVNQFSHSVLFQIIDFRVTRTKPTIYTTNKSAEELYATYKDVDPAGALIRRIGEKSETLKLTGAPYTLKE